MSLRHANSIADTLAGMRGIVLLAIGLAAVSATAAAPIDHASRDARARELIRLLQLKLLPGESGYLGIIGKSAQVDVVDGRPLAVQSQNYYMLTRERRRSNCRSCRGSGERLCP